MGSSATLLYRGSVIGVELRRPLALLRRVHTAEVLQGGKAVAEPSYTKGQHLPLSD